MRRAAGNPAGNLTAIGDEESVSGGINEYYIRKSRTAWTGSAH
jgi:hypothetical protein